VVPLTLVVLWIQRGGDEAAEVGPNEILVCRVGDVVSTKGGLDGPQGSGERM